MRGLGMTQGFSARIARFTREYRWPVIIGWLLALAVSLAGAVAIGGQLSAGGWYSPGSQSERAVHELAASNMAGRGHSTVTLVIRDQRHTAAEPQFGQRARDTAAAVTADPGLHVRSSYGWTTLGERSRDAFLGRDGRTTITALALDLEDGVARRDLAPMNDRIAARFAAQDLDVSLVGIAPMWSAINMITRHDLVNAELITFPLVALILLLLYRSVAAAVVSLLVGASAIPLTLGALYLVAQQIELSIFVQNTASLLGLGIAVDYSLFIVTRFREELHHGHSVPDAVQRSLRYAGHTVFFSGITVIASVATLFIVELNVLRSMALGMVTVVAFAILTTTIVLPAVLQVLGHRINTWSLPLRRPRSGTGRWYRFAMSVMRRPVTLGLIGVAFLAVLAAPASALRIFVPDARIIAEPAPVRVGFEHIRQQFGTGTTSPVQVVVRTADLTDPAAAERLIAVHDALDRLPQRSQTQSVLNVLRQVSPEQPFALLRPGTFERLPDDVRQTVAHYLSTDRRITVIELIPRGPASDVETTELVDAARRVIAEQHADAAVGGESAEGLDANAVIRDAFPAIVGLMLAVVFLLLLLTFRSLLLPLKAVAMNLLSVGATYGIMVAVFQDGIGADLLGLHRIGYLQNFVPVLLLATLFSLSTDYEVFLLSRVRENYLRSGDNRSAVAEAVESTAPLISGAAILMVAVFGAFAFTGMVPIEQLGFGMAVAILLDATVVRLLIVPATMRLMGRWNWWFPGRAPAPAPTEPKSLISR
ncbi:MMPL family transporter [Pseudonocardiaceae bacterium YIM PH 21723]|nr:MMPL family transporter [Pseudonocardiaceae bacterium YIM PH 21723]